MTAVIPSALQKKKKKRTATSVFHQTCTFLLHRLKTVTSKTKSKHAPTENDWMWLTQATYQALLFIQLPVKLILRKVLKRVLRTVQFNLSFFLKKDRLTNISSTET